MPSEQGYERQVAPRAPVAQPLATAEQFGAGLGRGLQKVGGSLARAEEHARRADADRQLTEGSARVATYTVGLRPQLAKLKRDYPRGGADYDGAVRELLTAGRDTLFDGIGDDRVRNELTRNLTDHDSRVTADADGFSIVAGAKGQIGDVNEFKRVHGSGLRMSENPVDDLGEALGQLGGLVGGLSLIDGDQQGAIARETTAELAGVTIERQVELDLAKASALLAKFAPLMTEQQVEHAQDVIALGMRQAVVAAKEDAAAAERATKEQQDEQRKVNADIALRAKNGDATPGEIASALRRSRDLGLDPAEVTELGYTGEASVQGRVFRSMTTPQLEDEGERLRGLQRAGQLDAEDARRLDRVDEAVKDRDDATGADLKDLSPEDQLTRLSQEPMARRLRLAKDIGGDKTALIAGLPPRARELALKGQRTRKDKAEAFMPLGEDGKPAPAAEATRMTDAAFQQLIGPHMARSLLASGQYETAREAALDYYVGNQVQAGVSGGWTKQRFAAATAYIFGARPRPGGGVQGGLAPVDGKITELPDRWTKQEFETRIARYDWDGAVYTDGSPAKKADVRANFHLVLLGRDAAGDWRYRVENDNGVWLRKKDGTPFLLPVPDRPR